MKNTKDLNGRLAAYSATSKSVAARLNWRERLGSWPTYCAATAAALASATSASASNIQYSGPINRTISVPASSFSCGCGVHTTQHVAGLPGAYFRLHIGHGTSGGVNTGAASGYFPILPGHSGYFRGGFQTVGSGSAVKFNAGSLIQSGLLGPFGGFAAKTSSGGLGFWRGATVTGFAGVLFYAGTTSVAGTHYPLYDVGWLRIRVQDLNGDQIPDSLTLIDYAYNTTPFAPILAGQAPEPSEASMLLLAAGAAGVMAWKRRKKAA